MGLYRAEGIVLANRDLGEADRIVILLCREHGKLAAVAKGARRPRNRLVGLTLPFNHLRLALFSGRGLDEISQVEGVHSFRPLRDDLLLLAHASALVEMTAEFLPEREPHPEVFDLLLKSLAGLEKGEDPGGMLGFFALNLLSLTGFRPALTRCLACGRTPTAEEESFFDIAAGGIYCPGCASAKAFSLPGPLRTAMAAALAGETHAFTPLTPSARRSLFLFLRPFLEYRLEKELHSLRFLAEFIDQDENNLPPSAR